MVDRANRKIEYLRISITDRCNLRCVYCMPEGGVPLIPHDEVLSYEEVLRIVRVAVKAGISKVRLTGGEPLVRKGVEGLVRDLAAIDGIKDLALTTNGLLLKKLAYPLFEAGLRRINISLDSLDPARFSTLTRGGALKDVLDGIEMAESAGFDPIKINMVPIRGLNDDEVVEFAKMTITRPWHVRFIEFMPIGAREMWDETRLVPTSETMAAVGGLGALEALTAGEFCGPASLYRLAGAKGIIGFISPLSDHFCAWCNRLRLTADGKLRPCLFSEYEVDLKTPLRAGCADEELSSLMGLAISEKPDGHNMDQGIKKSFKRTMSRIGG